MCGQNLYCRHGDGLHFSLIFFPSYVRSLLFIYPASFSLSPVPFLFFFSLFFPLFLPLASFYFFPALVLSLPILINLLFSCNPTSLGKYRTFNSFIAVYSKEFFLGQQHDAFMGYHHLLGGWHGSLLSFF